MSGTNALSAPVSPMPGGEPVNMPGAPAPRPGAIGPGDGPPPDAGAAMPTSFGDARKTLEQSHGEAKAAHAALGKALGGMEALKQSLTRLTEKGDIVTPEDVIEEAGKLVGRGLDPMALAGVLADMPQQGGGQALAGWLAQHAQAAAISEQQILQQRAIASHRLANTATHLLMAHAVGQAIVPPAAEGDMPSPGSEAPPQMRNQLNA